MPTLTPSQEFAELSTVLSASDTEVILRLTGIRVYDAGIEFAVPGALSFAEAFTFSHGFMGRGEITGDFMRLLRTLVDIPMMIPRGTILPMANLVESPFTDISYYSFAYNHYFQGVESRPAVHVDTGVDGLARIYAQLLVDVKLRYKRLKLQALPEIPYDCERHPLDGIYAPGLKGWVADLPTPDRYVNGSLSLFNRYSMNGNYYTSVYCDSYFLWNGKTFTEEEQEHSFLFPNTPARGFRTDGTGRPYFYGTDEDTGGLWPYKSIEPIPSSSGRVSVEYAYNFVGGELKFMTVEFGSPVGVYPPPDTGKRVYLPVTLPYIPVLIKGGIPPPVEIEPMKKLAALEIDGKWTIGTGGYKL